MSATNKHETTIILTCLLFGAVIFIVALSNRSDDRPVYACQRWYIEQNGSRDCEEHSQQENLSEPPVFDPNRIN